MRKREKIKLKKKKLKKILDMYENFFKNYSCKYSEAHTKV